MRSLYEGILGDINDTISKSDDNVNALSELAEARKLKFEPDKKDTCSVKFDCPNLLKCLDKRIITKLSKKSFGVPTTCMICYGYDSLREQYNMSIHIFDDKGSRCLVVYSERDYANKAKSAEIANNLIEYMLKSEDHFKMMLSLFDSNHISYKASYEFFEAPSFSPKSLINTLKRI